MGEKSLYLECETGISGDMTVAALLDLGADREVLQRTLKSLAEQNIGKFQVKISRVEKSGIGACDFDVQLETENPDHDMQYLYGHELADQGHDTEGHHLHGHHHRAFRDIRKIISETEMTEEARELSLRIFTILANAEGAVHGRNPEDVQFHEVGAVDSIVDILSAAVCYTDVKKQNGFKDCVIIKLTDGTGTIRCQHGIIPVPVPAVVKIAEQNRLPVSVTERKGEFVTPTGAAFAAAVKTKENLPDRYHILKTGYGAGKREYVVPGLLRAMIIEEI